MQNEEFRMMNAECKIPHSEFCNLHSTDDIILPEQGIP